MIRALAVLFFCLFFFSSCGSSGGGGGPQYDPTDPIQQVDELFTYDEGTKTTKITTSNGAYWSSYGYTLWSLNKKFQHEDFKERIVFLSKISGDNIAGYGIVVCHAYREDYGYTMVTVMINTQGRYTVGKVIGANYESVIGWKNCNHLRKGKGVENKLVLNYDKEEKKYTLFINDLEIESFTINDPAHESGRSGYIVVVSPQDDFPSVPVSVSFKEY
ncbi:MAG TPA: hypothetical protein GXZ47_10555 [Treponema sp.]|nr:hypothetical protein [Treponema sp.]